MNPLVQNFSQFSFQESAPYDSDIWALTEDAAWLVETEGYDPVRERESESLFTIGNGYSGTRGSLEEYSLDSQPGTFLAGVYSRPDFQPGNHLLTVAPDWLWTVVEIAGQKISLDEGQVLHHRRVLDMNKGFLYREWRHQAPTGHIIDLKTWRYASMADPHVLGQRVQVRWVSTQNEPEPLPLRLGLGLNARSRPERQESMLAVLQQQKLENGGILQVCQTNESNFYIAMASGTRLLSPSFPASGGALPPVPSLSVLGDEEIDSGKIQMCWDWQALANQWLAVERWTVPYTSRDLEEACSPPIPFFVRKNIPADMDERTFVTVMAQNHLARVLEREADGIMKDHVAAWQNRWEKAGVVIKGDDHAQRAVRFAITHLLNVAAPWNDKTSVGARALTGTVYEGHVFWDTEIFVLPFFIYTWPEAARSLLMYRYVTLPKARMNAQERGYQGAYYAWESAITGEEETPPYVRLPGGHVIRILSGEMEDHIVADVAYGTWHYWAVTADDEFLEKYGAEMILECARFWASRVSGPEEDALYHIRHVIGPDEYHEDVDDNAFTNAMAQWNLEKGIEVAAWLQANAPAQWQTLCGKYRFSDGEIHLWKEIASCMFLPTESPTGLLEQFDGFFEYLDPPSLATVFETHLPADVVFGRKTIKASQLIKQADVVMQLFLLRQRYTPKQRLANFNYYEPKTAHGSSLSPSIYGIVAAQLGKMDLAMKYFHQTATIDLDNPYGNAVGGVHIAAMGGLWQLMVFGFLGFSLSDPPAYGVEPHLPPTWQGLALKLCLQDQWLFFQVQREPGVEALLQFRIKNTGTKPLSFSLADQPAVLLEPGREYGAAQSGWDTWGPLTLKTEPPP